MAEKTIPKALSGEEIREIIKTQVTKVLMRDCFLSGHLAYAAFTIRGTLEISLQVTGPEDVKKTFAHLDIIDGEPVADVPVEKMDVGVDYESGPKPNVARQDNDLGVPALVTDATGHVTEKKIKYARKG